MDKPSVRAPRGRETGWVSGLVHQRLLPLEGEDWEDARNQPGVRGATRDKNVGVGGSSGPQLVALFQKRQPLLCPLPACVWEQQLVQL